MSNIPIIIFMDEFFISDDLFFVHTYTFNFFTLSEILVHTQLLIPLNFFRELCQRRRFIIKVRKF